MRRSDLFSLTLCVCRSLRNLCSHHLFFHAWKHFKCSRLFKHSKVTKCVVAAKLFRNLIISFWQLARFHNPPPTHAPTTMGFKPHKHFTQSFTNFVTDAKYEIIPTKKLKSEIILPHKHFTIRHQVMHQPQYGV